MLNSSFRRIITGTVFFLLTVVAAVIGYMVAGWNFLDAIYMVVITIFGVGYGEVQPLTSPTLKVFTIFVIIAGALSVAPGGYAQLCPAERAEEGDALLRGAAVVGGGGGEG